MYANVLSYRKLRITKGNEENHAEKEKKEEIGGQFSRRRKYLIRDVEEFFLLILGEGDRKKKKETQMEKENGRTKKRKRENTNRTTQYTAFSYTMERCSDL